MIKSLGKLANRFHQSEGGFTLVELLVVVAIIVALAAASVVSVAKFTGKGAEGATAAERDTVQSAIDTAMADKGVTAVTPNDLSNLKSGVKDFTSLPVEGSLVSYLRTNPTTYFYCWDGTGKVKQLTVTGACPAGPY